jgi:hypothetical protein
MFLIFSLFLQHFCSIYFLVPNIRYRTNIRQHILAEYSFSAKTENFVFGRSLANIIINFAIFMPTVKFCEYHKIDATVCWVAKG